MADLEVTTPEGVRRIRLERERVRIGRLAENDIAIPSNEISRQHAEIHYADGRWWIVDTQSTNGLHLRGKRIQQHRLVNGDRIALAPDIIIRFIDVDAPATRSQQPAQSSQSPQPASGTRFILERTPTPAMPAMPATPGPVNPAPRAPYAANAPVAPMYQAQAAPLPSSPPAAPPGTVPAPYPPLNRSPFADDEVPYVPPGMATIPPQHPAAQFNPPTNHPYMTNAPAPTPEPLQRRTMPAPRSFYTSGYDSATADRYASTSQPDQPDMETLLRDPYIRPTGGPTTTALYVCRTCSQLTPPDALYCQNCHHSIATECPRCRLSLLPIHDRCPRCQTPNPASVRKARRAPDA